MFGVEGQYQGFMYPGGYQQSRYNNQYGGCQSVMGQMGSQTIPVQQPVPLVIKGRPVSSFDEVKASIIDMDGSLFVFTDIANKMIHTKQIALDGTADIKTYRLVEEKPVTKQEHIEHVSGEYVSREEFDKVLSQINRRFDDIKGGLCL